MGSLIHPRGNPGMPPDSRCRSCSESGLISFHNSLLILADGTSAPRRARSAAGWESTLCR